MFDPGITHPVADSVALPVEPDRLIDELMTLSRFSSCPEPHPAVTRIVFSEEDLAARAYLAGLYRDAGLTVRVDAVGNTFARWVGREPDLPAVATGSHTDAIPHSGLYDGTVGVLGGLEAIRTLRRSGFQPRRSIELVMITSEEPTRFDIGCLGSRVMAGALDENQLGELTDDAGDDFHTVRHRAGFSGDVADAVLCRGHYHAWLELHIEQGPVLESERLPIGIVTAIAAPATIAVTVTGGGGHAGGVLMPDRRDALCGAAEMAVRIERLAHDSASSDLVATVGRFDVHPGAVNSIPAEVRFTIDLRDIDLATREPCRRAIEAACQSIADRRSLTMELRTINADPPAASDPFVISAMRSACQQANIPHRTMISRAYHDSLFMAQVAPMGMLFIPCRGGVSHRPDEFSSPAEIATGVQILSQTLAELAK